MIRKELKHQLYITELGDVTFEEWDTEKVQVIKMKDGLL